MGYRGHIWWFITNYGQSNSRFLIPWFSQSENLGVSVVKRSSMLESTSLTPMNAHSCSSLAPKGRRVWQHSMEYGCLVVLGAQCAHHNIHARCPSTNVGQCPMVLGAPPTTLAAADSTARPEPLLRWRHVPSAQAWDADEVQPDYSLLWFRPHLIPEIRRPRRRQGRAHQRRHYNQPGARHDASKLQDPEGKRSPSFSSIGFRCGQLQFGTNFLSVQKACLGEAR